jgi:5-methylthioadenosine/S-adenosylhomocysteine deaminase
VSLIGDAVLGTDSGSVDSVFIAGRAVKRDGRLLDVDLPALLLCAQQGRDGLLQRANIAPAL